ncbi:unnamed protein product [Absidia cylindrospora]
MNQLDVLFEDHLNWFPTRRTLTDENTTTKGPSKRAQFNSQTQHQPDSQQTDIDFEPHSKQDDTKVNSISTNTTAITTTTIDSEFTQPIPPASPAPPAPPEKISREYLLRHFEQEEQKHGRYGLRNRSLGSSLASSSSKQSTKSANTPEQQRRKTIDCANNDNENGNFNFIPAVDETTKATPVTDNVATPMPATSSAIDTTHSVRSPTEEANTPTTTKDQRHRTYSQEEQIDDEVLLLPRPNNNSSAASLKDSPSRLDQHSILSVGSNTSKQNNSLIANESYSFSSIFSFKRASSSALESSILYEDPKTSSNSSNSKAYTPKRHTDSYHARPSRLTIASSPSQSKGKVLSSTSLGTASRTNGQTNSSLAPTSTMLLKHRSSTPGQPSTTTPVPSSFLSLSPVTSESSTKRNTLRPINVSQSSSNKKPSKENEEVKQDQKLTEGLDQTNEPQNVNDPATDETPEPTEVVIPSWASHPELDKLLQEQIKVDADKIFGKMPPLQVSQIVKMGH